MTRKELLLVQLAEECAEVQQQVSKALRFGLTDTKPNEHETNAQRLRSEMEDLFGVYKMLNDEGYVDDLRFINVEKKSVRVEKYLEYSQSIGNLSYPENATCKKGYEFTKCSTFIAAREGCAECSNFIR